MKLEDLRDVVSRMPGVESARVWEGRVGRRLYINLEHARRSFRGVRNHKLYVREDGRLVDERGPGRTPSEYEEAYNMFRSAWDAMQRGSLDFEEVRDA